MRLCPHGWWREVEVNTLLPCDDVDDELDEACFEEDGRGAAADRETRDSRAAGSAGGRARTIKTTA